MENEVTELAHQIKQLFQDHDQQTIKFILAGQTTESLQKLCKCLPQEMASSLRTMYAQLPKDQEYEIQDQQQRNKRIDMLLQKDQIQHKNQSFLEMISKANQKLIYEEYFGFHFYDLCKRILITNGDLHPVMASIKTIHSQIQILYSALFSVEVMEWIGENYQNLSIGLRQFLSSIFPIECQKYFKFHRIYKNIKKQTAEEQEVDESNEQQKKEMGLNEDQTLQMDQKQFLVSLSDYAEEFQQFQKNRSYNFLCFGLRNYQTFIGLGPHIYSQIKERQFCQLLSFISIRFVRKILFTIIRQKNNGQLIILKESITSQDIKRIGNQIVDFISNKIKQYTTPARSIQQDAKALFLQEFQPYSYRDFIPRKAVMEARSINQPLAQYVWRICKQYKTIWGQRIKSQHFIKTGGIRPQFDYVNYIEQNKTIFEKDPAKLWKEFIMIKFGFVNEQKVVTRKKMKLDSLND